MSGATAVFEGLAPRSGLVQRLNSADDKKRSFLTVRWNDLLAIILLSLLRSRKRALAPCCCTSIAQPLPQFLRRRLEVL